MQNETSALRRNRTYGSKGTLANRIDQAGAICNHIQCLLVIVRPAFWSSFWSLPPGCWSNNDRDAHVNTGNINVDDAVLVERCRAGDSFALERLILKYQNRVYNVILRICTNPDDSAELTQETFVKVIESLDGFRGKSSFYTWLFRIAVNLTLNHCKRAAKFDLKSLDAEGYDDSSDARQLLKDVLSDASSPDPAALAQSRELCELAIDCLMKLDDAHRAVVVLRDIEGMNYTQIAKVLDIELGTVRSRLSRARTNLRHILETRLE